MEFDWAKELKELPDKPGVYLMHDAMDHIIYVGKAIVLKNRVRQYFRKSTKKSPKIERMVSRSHGSRPSWWIRKQKRLCWSAT